MSREDAERILDMLKKGGSLAEVFDQVEAELKSRSEVLVTLDLESEDSLAKARKLQGEIKGGLAALDRIKEIVTDVSQPD